MHSLTLLSFMWIFLQLPRTTEIYVHRSGRTARATKAGLALMLVGPTDVVYFKKICNTLGKDENIPLFPVQAKCMPEIKVNVKKHYFSTFHFSGLNHVSTYHLILVKSIKNSTY